MSETHKTVPCMFGSWQFTEIAEYLNKQSANGWQLEKIGLFCWNFVKNTEQRYIYQLDWQDNMSNQERYLSFFEQQGWEKISQNGSPYYFRKRYDEDMGEEEKQIYTDVASRRTMYKRIFWYELIFSLMYFNAMISTRDIFIGIARGLFLLISFLILYNIRREGNGKKPLFHIKGRLFWYCFILILLAGIAREFAQKL